MRGFRELEKSLWLGNIYLGIFVSFFGAFVSWYLISKFIKKKESQNYLLAFHQTEKRAIKFYHSYIFNSYKKLTYWDDSWGEKNYLKISAYSDLDFGLQLKKTFLEDEERAELFQVEHYIKLGGLFSPYLTPSLLFLREYDTWGILSFQGKFPYIYSKKNERY